MNPVPPSRLPLGIRPASRIGPKLMRHPSLVVLAGAASLFAATLPVSSKPDMGKVSSEVVELLERFHFSRENMDETLSQKLLKDYLESLDYRHLFFLQSDVDRLTEKYGTKLGRHLALGNLDPAFEIFDLFQMRVRDRIAKIQEQLAANPDLEGADEYAILDRSKAAWPASPAEADRLWQNAVAAELLQEKLNRANLEKENAKEKAAEEKAEKKDPSDPSDPTDPSDPPAKTADQPVEPAEAVKADDPPAKVIARRYERFLKNLNERDREAQASDILTVVAQTYDPHSEYMKRSENESFQISMKLSLVGIGALLGTEDGCAQILDLVPGGPADLDGRLRAKDKITGVAQGDGEFEDVVDLPLDEVVDKIRGKKGTTVRLQVIPAKSTSSSAREIIEIVRDEVKLKDQEAKAELIEHKGPDGKIHKLGWIHLRSFYADLEQKDPNQPGTTRDVALLIERLKKEGIEGLVVDLSRNGGGSLDEAVRLTGLFIKEGPVVQAKRRDGVTTTSGDDDPNVLYDGPLVVLTSRHSASASEIFAAALQDDGRAVIVGDRSTFGKGTVQTLFDLDVAMNPLLGQFTKESGVLKLTIQKFYRIAGGSTQFEGVHSDVVLPSTTDYEEIGERSLKNPLPYDTVAPSQYDRIADLAPAIARLVTASKERVEANPEFSYLREDMTRFLAKLKENRVSLDFDTRDKEIGEQEALQEKRDAAREALPDTRPTSYKITLSNLNEPKLEPIVNRPRTKKGVAAAKADKEAKEAKDNADPEAAQRVASIEDNPDDDNYFDRPERPAVDPIKDETLHILEDLIAISNEVRTAAVPVGGNSKASAYAPE